MCGCVWDVRVVSLFIHPPYNPPPPFPFFHSHTPHTQFNHPPHTQAIAVGLSHVRDGYSCTPNEVLELLVSYLQGADNRCNPYTDAHLIAAFIEAVGNVHVRYMWVVECVWGWWSGGGAQRGLGGWVWCCVWGAGVCV